VQDANFLGASFDKFVQIRVKFG